MLSSISFFTLRKKQLHVNQKNYKKSKSLFKITLGLNFAFVTTYFMPGIVFTIKLHLDTNMPFALFCFLNLLQYFYQLSDFFNNMATNRLFRETFFYFIQMQKKEIIVSTKKLIN